MVRMFKDWSIALLAAAVVFLAFGWFRGGSAPDLPDQAPLFHLVDLDGRAVNLDSYLGSTVVVNFWASWCGPCKSEIPEFARFSAAHPDIVMLGLAVDSGDEIAVARAAREFGITWTVAIADRYTKKDYALNGVPMTVIVNPDGSVRKTWYGAISQETLERALR